MTIDIHTSRLKALGLTKAAETIVKAKVLTEKLTIAYQHYRFVSPEKITAFNEKLMQETLKETRSHAYYKQLMFTAIEKYERVPSIEVLNELEVAQSRKCFDTFEIAEIQAVERVKDPILFGRVTGCEDRFFIAQWDDDVNIDDILQGDEGYVKAGHE